MRKKFKAFLLEFFVVTVISFVKKLLKKKLGENPRFNAWWINIYDEVSPLWHRDLERCYQEFVKYMGIPTGLENNRRIIAASVVLYPHMEKLCKSLDDKQIPHPEIDYDGLAIVDTGIWSKFLGKLMSVQHDINLARNVYYELTKKRPNDS